MIHLFILLDPETIEEDKVNDIFCESNYVYFNIKYSEGP